MPAVAPPADFEPNRDLLHGNDLWRVGRDGGDGTAPRFAFFTTEGTWEVENRGVQPDIEIELDPHVWRGSHDLQLEKAVEVTLKELEKNPPPAPKQPPYPDYSKYSSIH